MGKIVNNRRMSSILRDNLVHDIYQEELGKLGNAGRYISKEYLYGKVKERVGLSIRSISFIINHTRKRNI
jgi:hypothetical protein